MAYFPPIGHKFTMRPSFWEGAAVSGKCGTPIRKEVEATVVSHNVAHGWYRVEYTLGGNVQHEILYAQHGANEGVRVYGRIEQKLRQAVASPPEPEQLEPKKAGWDRRTAPVPITITNNETGEVLVFPSITQAARHLGVNSASVGQAAKNGWKVKGWDIK